MVSVCIPTYNNLQAFKRCLESVLIQDFREYEIIVSDDSTNADIETYLNTQAVPGLAYQRNTPALGSPANWNKCLQLAKGKYIKILHHDDYFSGSTALSEFVKALESNPSASFAFCYSTVHFKKQAQYFLHRQTKTQLRRLKDDVNFLFYRNVIGSPSATLFRNDTAITFDPRFKWLVDVAFYITFLKRHKGFCAINQALVTVTDGEEGQITQSVSRNARLVIQENLDLFSGIYPEQKNTKSALLFFEELFLDFDIKDLQTLKRQCEIPRNLEGFLYAVFKDISRNTVLKKIKKRILTSRYNKKIFQIERF